jgi:hypothetical protein
MIQDLLILYVWNQYSMQTTFKIKVISIMDNKMTLFDISVDFFFYEFVLFR